MDIKAIVDRIEKVMAHYDLSASTFADKIGVQRSSISHLLKGRNKPSLDFLLKIKNAYPDMDINWILFGQGNLTNTITNSSKSIIAPPPTAVKNLSSPKSKNKEIDKVIIFYTDGTFKLYKEE